MLECGRTELHVAGLFTRPVRETGTFADRPRSGVPRVTTVRQDIHFFYIRQRHLRDMLLTAESTCSEVVGNRGVPVSRYTVRNRLLEWRRSHTILTWKTNFK